MLIVRLIMWENSLKKSEVMKGELGTHCCRVAKPNSLELSFLVCRIQSARSAQVDLL